MYIIFVNQTVQQLTFFYLKTNLGIEDSQGFPNAGEIIGKDALCSIG